MNKKTFGIEINNILQQILIKRSDFQTLMNKIDEMIKERDEELSNIITNIKYTDRNINYAIKKMEEILNDLSTKVDKYINNRILIDELAPQIKQKFIEIFEKFLNIYIKYENQIKEYLNRNLEELLYNTDNNYNYNIFNKNLIDTDEDYDNELYRYAQPLGENNWYGFKGNDRLIDPTCPLTVFHYLYSYKKSPIDLLGNGGSLLYEHLFYHPLKGMIYYKSSGYNETNNTYKDPSLGMALEMKYHLMMCDTLMNKSFKLDDRAFSPSIGNTFSEVYKNNNDIFISSNYFGRSALYDSNRVTGSNSVYDLNPSCMINVPLFLSYTFLNNTTTKVDFIHKIKTIKGREWKEPHIFLLTSKKVDPFIYKNNTQLNDREIITISTESLLIKPYNSNKKEQTPINSLIDYGNEINDTQTNLIDLKIDKNKPKWNTFNNFNSSVNTIKSTNFWIKVYIPSNRRTLFSHVLYSDPSNTKSNLLTTNFTGMIDSNFIATKNNTDTLNNPKTIQTRRAFVRETNQNFIGTVKKHKKISNIDNYSLFASWFPKIDYGANITIYDTITPSSQNKGVSLFYKKGCFYRMNLGEHIALANFEISKDLYLDTYYNFFIPYTYTLRNSPSNLTYYGWITSLTTLDFTNSIYENSYSEEIALHPQKASNSEDISGDLNIGYREDFVDLDQYDETDFMWFNSYNRAGYMYDQLSQSSARSISRFYYQGVRIINNEDMKKVSAFEGSTSNFLNHTISNYTYHEIKKLYNDIIDFFNLINDEPIGTLKFIPYDTIKLSNLYAKAGSILKKSEYPEAYEIFGDKYYSEATESFDSNEYFALPNFSDKYLIGGNSSDAMSIIENSLPQLSFEVIFDDTTLNKDDDKSHIGIITKNKIDSSNDGKFTLGTLGNGAAIIDKLEVNNTSTDEITKGNDFRTDIYIKVKPINEDPFMLPEYMTLVRLYAGNKFRK